MFKLSLVCTVWFGLGLQSVGRGFKYEAIVECKPGQVVNTHVLCHQAV